MTRPRFTIRSLIWAIVLIALGLGLIAHVREDRRLYRELAAERQRARLEVVRAELAARQAEVALAAEQLLRVQAEAEAKAKGSARSR